MQNNSNNYIDTQYQIELRSLNENNERIKKYSEGVKTIEKEIEHKKHELHRYDTMNLEYSGNHHAKTANLNPIELDSESTLIEVSDYLKNGGGGGDEWPWKVMEASKNSSDKWITL